MFWRLSGAIMMAHPHPASTESGLAIARLSLQENCRPRFYSFVLARSEAWYALHTKSIRVSSRSPAWLKANQRSRLTKGISCYWFSTQSGSKPDPAHIDRIYTVFCISEIGIFYLAYRDEAHKLKPPGRGTKQVVVVTKLHAADSPSSSFTVARHYFLLTTWTSSKEAPPL